ncbi:carbohydrate ABC transporter permease [Phytomonospora sp. NPDC050363]|uniref:carbohydrate ABC transporter permease n=1 Tax=Phytomonospora sp. NPDC050363 TaxID=3155642 RepID=UPI0033D707B7
MATTTSQTAPAPVENNPPTGGKQKKTGGVLNVFSHGFLFLWAVMIILPLIWMVVTSLKNNTEIFTDPLGLPDVWQFENYIRAWEKAGIGQFFINTIIVVGGGVFFTMTLGSMAAYVLARYEFRGNRFFFYMFVSGMMFPVFLALVPLYYIVDGMGLLGTFHGLILVYTAYSLPFTVFFLTSFFRTLPTGVAEAAMIDGAGHYRLFFQVMLPMAKPGIISIAIFNVIGQWNQFLMPLVLMPGESNSVITQGIANIAVQERYNPDFSALMASMVISMVPVLIAYIIFQRQIQAGMTAGALK